MIYTLDTNAIAAILRGDRKVMDALERRVRRGHDVTLNAVSYFETRRGLKPAMVRKRELFEALLQQADLLGLERPELDVAATIYGDLRDRGAPLEDADVLVAGIAIANGAVLVTRNLKHFRRIEGLQLESWEA